MRIGVRGPIRGSGRCGSRRIGKSAAAGAEDQEKNPRTSLRCTASRSLRCRQVAPRQDVGLLFGGSNSSLSWAIPHSEGSTRRLSAFCPHEAWTSGDILPSASRVVLLSSSSDRRTVHEKHETHRCTQLPIGIDRLRFGVRRRDTRRLLRSRSSSVLPRT